MSNITDQYAELLNLTRQYLLQNYADKATKATDLESFTYFKRCAQQQREQHARNPQSSPVTSSISTPSSTQQRATAVNTPNLTKQELPKHSLTPPTYPVTAAPVAQQQNKIVTPTSHPTIQPKKKDVTPLPFSNATSVAENAKPIQSEKKIVDTVLGDPKALFQLAPLTPAARLDLSDIKQIISERFPAQKIIDEIPSDDVAKRTSIVSNTPPLSILILAFAQNPKQQMFLSNIANAITILFKVNVQVVDAVRAEQEIDWVKELNDGALRLIITSGALITTLPKVMQHYREERKESDNSIDNKYYLGKTPLYLLPDMESYFKDPKLKVALWQSISAYLS